jgi:hypothetical protein
MIYGDMQKKREIALKKVKDAINADGGTTLLATGITGDDARFALAAVEAGARMLEPNHPAVALARGHKGVTSMHAAEEVRHEIDFDEMCRVTAGVRAVVGHEIYIKSVFPVPLQKQCLLHLQTSKLMHSRGLVLMVCIHTSLPWQI